MSEQTQATPAAAPAPRKAIIQTLTGRVVGDKMNKTVTVWSSGASSTRSTASS